jgi:hypothetical protein
LALLAVRLLVGFFFPASTRVINSCDQSPAISRVMEHCVRQRRGSVVKSTKW